MIAGVNWRVARTVPSLVVMATIFFLSHQPGDALQLPSLPGIDKLAHAVVYGVLAATALLACTSCLPGADSRSIAVGVIVFCLLFGLSDEYHQSFIVGRMASCWDLLADGVGASLIAGLWWRRNGVTIG